MADIFVLTLINKQIISGDAFSVKENGAVIMDDETRKLFLSQWQMKKQETITHPFLNEKIEWGMVPYVQSMLLARYIRGDLDEYPSFLWKQVLMMLVLITYDVNTETAAGRSRLRRVAKQCVNYGQRVQNSVFESNMDAAKCRAVKGILEGIIDKNVDSLRFYYLSDNYKHKVEHIGAKPGFDVTEPLIF